jgi:hypothetical protein
MAAAAWCPPADAGVCMGGKIRADAGVRQVDAVLHSMLPTVIS